MNAPTDRRTVHPDSPLTAADVQYALEVAWNGDDLTTKGALNWMSYQRINHAYREQQMGLDERKEKP